MWRTQYYLDYVGQVFQYNGKVYRLINADKENYVRKLFSDRIISDLVKRGWLVKTKINEDSKKIMFSVIDLMDDNEKAYDLKKDRYQSLSQYTRKYLITEFMPLGLWAGDDENCPPVPEWYTLEWFLEGIKEKFNIIKVEQISRNRVAVLGEKADRR